MVGLDVCLMTSAVAVYHPPPLLAIFWQTRDLGMSINRPFVEVLGQFAVVTTRVGRTMMRGV